MMVGWMRSNIVSMLQGLTNIYLCGIVILTIEMRSLYNSLKVNLGSGNLLQEGETLIVLYSAILQTHLKRVV